MLKSTFPKVNKKASVNYIHQHALQQTGYKQDDFAAKYPR